MHVRLMDVLGLVRLTLFVTYFLKFTPRFLSFGLFAPVVYKCNGREIKPGAERFFLDVFSLRTDKLVG